MEQLSGQLSETANILVVDGSKSVRVMLEKILKKSLPDASITLCETAGEAISTLDNTSYDLVCTSLLLSDMDGGQLAHAVRQNNNQKYMPIIVISGDTENRVLNREMASDVSDYFDKSLGLKAMADFIVGYTRPQGAISGRILYVEDSRVVAVATKRMLQKHGIEVTHTINAEDALALLEEQIEGHSQNPVDLLLTDVYLKGGMTGKDLLQILRDQKDISKRDFPILVMTGDDEADNQRALLEAGANDLILKPVDELVLVSKLRFQLNLKQHQNT